MSKKYQRLVLERKGAILTIKLSSPEKRNAVDAFMHEELPQALREAAMDKTIGAIVLTGDPAGRAFCAGGDLDWIKVLSNGDGDDYSKVLREGVEVLRALIDARQPVISMINGAAMGRTMRRAHTQALPAPPSRADAVVSHRPDPPRNLAGTRQRRGR